MSADFPALVVRKDPDGTVSRAIERLTPEQLPAGEVLIRVECSSLNYKDALSATGHPGVTKQFPHVPGIDAAGTVVEGGGTPFKPGDRVLVTGFDLGAGRWGGYSELLRVPADWVVRVPASLTAREAMIYGTAGFTAGMSIEVLQAAGISPASGPILVTGASGGVGSLAVAILAKLGYTVEAATGKDSAHLMLKELGATRFLNRDEVQDASDRPLLKARWAGAVDSVGGKILATALRSSQPNGCVTACGLTAGTDLPLTVYPFILRGVRLVGIESAWYPLPKRISLWDKLSGPWKPDRLERVVSGEFGLDQLEEPIGAILAGRIAGRTLVKTEPRP
jgi:putative YhdH/YhfP family quinone oxidoreductase